MDVRDLLERKGSQVFSIAPQESLARCVEVLNEKRVGALLVIDQDDVLAGIISERDIMRATHALREKMFAIRVEQIMTPRKVLITAYESEPVAELMEAMTKNRIRHLPILDGEKVVGVISIGDVVRELLDKTSAENEYLHSYINGR